jgi:hypothetical protein
LREQEEKGSELAPINRANFELVRPSPTKRDVREMLDVSYVASLCEEEGRKIRLKLGYLSPGGATALKFSSFQFARPMPFTSSSLAKVALATHPDRTTVGVWRAKQGGLEVWGLIQHGDQRFAIDLEHKPTYFSIRVLRPGTVEAHFDERLALLFSRDHYHIFKQEFGLLSVLRDRCGLKPAVAEALCRLTVRTLEHGHGGTILVGNTGRAFRGLSMHRNFGYKGDAHCLLNETLEEAERAWRGELGIDEQKPVERYRRAVEIRKKHSEALDFVARLTAVDGAVVLTDELCLLGFGAKIATPASKAPSTIIHEDPRLPGVSKTRPVSWVGGNRHHSAVCFCAQQEPMAIALVCSQDGDVSLVARSQKGPVYVIKPYELGIGI